LILFLYGLPIGLDRQRLHSRRDGRISPSPCLTADVVIGGISFRFGKRLLQKDHRQIGAAKQSELGDLAYLCR
jgi:hypothetical protein